MTVLLKGHSIYISEESFRSSAKIISFCLSDFFRKVQKAFKWPRAVQGSSQEEMPQPPTLVGLVPVLSFPGQP